MYRKMYACFLMICFFNVASSMENFGYSRSDDDPLADLSDSFKDMSLDELDDSSNTTSMMSDVLKPIAIGGLAGLGEVTLNQWLSGLKLEVQAEKNKELYKGKNAFEVMKTFAKKNKGSLFKTLYANYGSNATSMPFITAMQFAGSRYFKQYLSHDGEKGLTSYEEALAPFMGGFLSGFASCVGECAMVHQQGGESVIGALKHIVKQHGPKALYRGFFPIAFRDAFFSAGFQYLSGFIADSILQELPISMDMDNPLVRAFVGGIPAGILTAIVTHPLDTMSTKMKGDLACQKYKNSWVTLSTILREGGVKELSAGWEFRTGRVGAAVPMLTLFSLLLQPIFYDTHKK